MGNFPDNSERFLRPLRLYTKLLHPRARAKIVGRDKCRAFFARIQTFTLTRTGIVVRTSRKTDDLILYARRVHEVSGERLGKFKDVRSIRSIVCRSISSRMQRMEYLAIRGARSFSALVNIFGGQSIVRRIVFRVHPLACPLRSKLAIRSHRSETIASNEKSSRHAESVYRSSGRLSRNWPHCEIVLRRIHLGEIKSTHPFTSVILYGLRSTLLLPLYRFVHSLSGARPDPPCPPAFSLCPSLSLSAALSFSHVLRITLADSLPLSFTVFVSILHALSPGLSGQSRSIEPALICIATSRAARSTTAIVSL